MCACACVCECVHLCICVCVLDLAMGEQGMGSQGPTFPAVDSLFQMKTGPFAEHSNQLWNISAVPTWSKVNQGLIRMYKAEVRGAGWGPGSWGCCFPTPTPLLGSEFGQPF